MRAPNVEMNRRHGLQDVVIAHRRPLLQAAGGVAKHEMNISEMADAIRRKSVVVIPFKPSMRRPGTT
jgi:hypothetical protein